MTTILLTGKTGQVGSELQRTLSALGHVIAFDRTELDLTRPDEIIRTIRSTSPDIIVNAAGYTSVDKAESNPAIAMEVNAMAPGVMAEEARRLHALLVHYSTDYVFDGRRSEPYTEEDEPNPVNAYGRSKLEGERVIKACDCAHLILRTSWIYSARGTNFVLTMLKLARERDTVAVVDDQIGSPTWARTLAEATATLLADLDKAKESVGIYHLSANGYPSRFDFAEKIIAIARDLSGEKDSWAQIRRTTTESYPLPAMRPLRVATSKEKVGRIFRIQMADWEHQLESFLRETAMSMHWHSKRA